MKPKQSNAPLLELKTHLIQQNCYIRDVSVAPAVSVGSVDKFVSLDEVVTDKGIELRETEHDYPITPEYVNSFAESASYKTDVVGAVAKAQPGKNLGDIRAMQDVSSMDMEHARALYTQLAERFAKAQSAPAPAPDTTIKKEGEN